MNRREGYLKVLQSSLIGLGHTSIDYNLNINFITIRVSL